MVYLYLYKEYNDELVYGEEYLKLYATEEEAKARLRKGVHDAYGMTIEEMLNDPDYADEVIDDDYVLIRNDGGDASFFVVERIALESTAPENIDLLIAGLREMKLIAQDNRS